MPSHYSAYRPFSRAYTPFGQPSGVQSTPARQAAGVSPSSSAASPYSQAAGTLGSALVQKGISKPFAAAVPGFAAGATGGQIARMVGGAAGIGTEGDAGMLSSVIGGAAAGSPIAGMVGEILRNVGEGTYSAITGDWDMSKSPVAIEQKTRQSLAGPLWEKELEALSREDLERITDIPNIFEFGNSGELKEELLDRVKIINDMDRNVAFQIEKAINPSITLEEFGNPGEAMIDYAKSLDIPDIEQIKGEFTPGMLRGGNISLGMGPLLEEYKGQPIEEMLRSISEQPADLSGYDLGDISKEFEGVFFLENPEEWAGSTLPSRGQRSLTTATGGLGVLPQGFGTPAGGTLSFLGLTAQPMELQDEPLYLRAIRGY